MAGSSPQHADGTMTAAIVHAHGERLALERVAIPEPGFGEVLIDVIACGVCHSDVHAVDGDWDPISVMPLIPGHEVTGRVAALGDGVDGFAVGDLVGVPWMYSACGRCEWCLTGMETICPAAEATGYTKAGGYAEFMVAAADFVARLPETVDPVAIAPILCAGVTTYRGLKRTGGRPGQWIAIIGIGGLGHLAVQYAVAMGMRVVAVDVSADKLDLALSHGAELVVNASEVDPVEAVQTAIGGAHVALVAAVATRAFEQAIGMVRHAGTIVYVGLPGGTADEMRLSIGALISGERSIRGSNVGTRADLQEAVDFAVRGLVATSVRRARIDTINDVFDEMCAGRIVGRVVLEM